MDNARNHEARYEYEMSVLLEMARIGVPIIERSFVFKRKRGAVI